MGEYTWIDVLRHEARKHRMCAENRNALANPSITKEEAIRLYKRTIDWALEEDYPTLDFLRKEFSGFEHLGIYLDRNFGGDLLNDTEVYILHHCSGTILVDLNIKKRIIPMIYLANGCDITIRRAEGESVNTLRVPVYVFGDNKVNAVSGEDVTFLINRFDLK